MKDKVALAGSLVSAIAASLCCIGPLVAVVIGLGTFTAAAAFEVLRPYLIAASSLLLAGSFYLIYQKRQPECEGGTCQVRGANRASKIMLWIVTIAVIAFAAFPYYSGALLKASARNIPVPDQSVVAEVSKPEEAVIAIGVEGMTCGSCATAVRMALTKIEGVHSAEVSFEKNEARLTYDPALVQPAQMKNAIDKAGFMATGMRSVPNQ